MYSLSKRYEVKKYTIDLKKDVKLNSFVESVEDDSKVTLSFKNKVTKDEKQTVTIIAKDAYGNCTMKDTTLTLKNTVISTAELTNLLLAMTVLLHFYLPLR